MFINCICSKKKGQFEALKCHFQENSKMAAVSMETKNKFLEHGFSESWYFKDFKTVFKSLLPL